MAVKFNSSTERLVYEIKTAKSEGARIAAVEKFEKNGEFVVIEGINNKGQDVRHFHALGKNGEAGKELFETTYAKGELKFQGPKWKRSSRSFSTNIDGNPNTIEAYQSKIAKLRSDKVILTGQIEADTLKRDTASGNAERLEGFANRYENLGKSRKAKTLVRKINRFENIETKKDTKIANLSEKIEAARESENPRLAGRLERRSGRIAARAEKRMGKLCGKIPSILHKKVNVGAYVEERNTLPLSPKKLAHVRPLAIQEEKKAALLDDRIYLDGERVLRMDRQIAEYRGKLPKAEQQKIVLPSPSPEIAIAAQPEAPVVKREIGTQQIDAAALNTMFTPDSLALKSK